LAIIVALAVTGCGGSSREESALGKSVNAVFDENPGTMARYCHFHVNVVEKGMYDAEFFQRDVRAFEEGVGFKLLREYHEHGVKPEDIVRMINRRCEHADKGNSKTEATAQPTSSISQLQHEAAAQHEIAQGYLRQTEQIVREGIAKGEEYASEKEHAKSVRLIKLERAAQSRADALHRQMCELVLQDPRTPHNDRLGRIALECE
ncbi:MAG TPA: hypothetical protein VFP23_07550, partial [Solirubrobacterales bacterium]|nr:hypothetical protein [Solirubrobacterales bacterium]